MGNTALKDAAANICLVDAPPKENLKKSKSKKKGKEGEVTTGDDVTQSPAQSTPKLHINPLAPKVPDTYAVYFKWNDPAAVGNPDTPGPEVLEYKKGSYGKYTVVDCKHGRSQVLNLAPGTYMAKYRVGKVGMLCPGQIAPTLLRKAVEAAQKKLGDVDFSQVIGDGEGDPQIEQLPDGKVKDLLVKLQDAMPANKFVIKPTFQKKSGKWPKGKRYLNTDQQTRRFFRKKSEDPVIRATAKVVAKRAAIEGAKALISQIGLGIEDLLDELADELGVDGLALDLDTKLDNLEEGDDEADIQQAIDDAIQEAQEKAAEEQEKQAEQNLPANLIAASSKRPRVAEGVKIPVQFSWAEAAGGTNITCVYWKWNKPDKQKTVTLTKKPAPPESDKKATKEFIPGYEGFACLAPGKYRYRWVIDGKGYYKPTRPTDDHPESGKSFRIRLILPE